MVGYRGLGRKVMEGRKSRSTKLLALGLVAAVALWLLAGCGTVSGNAGGAYKVGALFAVTGFNSPLGTPERDTAQMVAEQINAKGGINGHKIELVVYDTESEETKAVTLAKKLIEQDKVLAIIGPSSTGESMALVDAVTKAKVPLVSCAASAQIVEPAADRQWVFKTPQSDVLAVNEIYDYLKKSSMTKVALLTSSGGYGTTGKAALEQVAKVANIAIVASETFGDKDTDMTVQLKKIQGTDAQAIIVWGTNPGPAIIAKNAKQLGVKQPIINSHGIANAKFLELAGDAAEGTILPGSKLLVIDSLPESDPQKALLASYAKDFQAKYGVAPDPFGGYAYDSLMLVASSLEKAGTDKEKLRAAIENAKGVAGITGVFDMSAQDHNGLSKGAFVMIKVTGGKWTLLK